MELGSISRRVHWVSATTHRRQAALCNRLTLTFKTATVLFTGRVVKPGTTQTLSFKGVALPDVGLGLGMAAGLGLSMPVTAAVRDAYEAAHTEGFGNLDMAGVIALYEKWAGVKVRGKAAAGEKP